MLFFIRIFISCLIMILFSCEKNEVKVYFIDMTLQLKCDSLSVDATITRKNDSLFILRTDFFYENKKTGSDFRQLPFPVFKFITGDVDRDGNPDLILGTIKKTRFDKEPGKRISIFSLKDMKIKTLWMGSRLSRPLVDFRFDDESGKIISLEKEQNGTWLVAEYQWEKFGLKFIRYIKRNCNLVQTINMIYNPGFQAGD